ncbi:MAG: HAD family hydrolase [Crenarchaeota archaeon]|nr:HAD family hydrolase [Thermoproteota archaeon]
MILVAVDLFGTLIPLETDHLAHRMLAEAVCRAAGCDPREFEEAYWRAVEVAGDSSLAVFRSFEELCRARGLRNVFSREELEYLHAWSHIEAAREMGELPYARPFLASLKGRGAIVGVVSDAAPGVPRGILRALDLDTLVNEVVASGECGFKKPDPRLLEALVARVGARPSRVIVVGDSPRDVAMARAFGAISVALNPVDGASYVARNLAEALRIIIEILEG